MDADHIHAWEQGNVAESLLSGRGFGSPFASTQPSAIMPPVYPLVVAALFKLFGIHTAASIVAAHALNCLLNALACIPIFLVTRNSFGEDIARYSTWFWALSPYGIYFSAAWAWSTHILLLCLCWLLYLAQKLETSPQLTLWAGFGVLAGFAGMTEPVILPAAAFLALLSVWRLRKLEQKWLLPAALCAVVVAITIAPWMIRNAIVFHRFIPMRDSMGLELWMGNNGYSLRWTSDQLHPLHNTSELADYNRLGEAAYMNHKLHLALVYISEHPAWYSWMCTRRAIYIWTGFWSFNPEYLRLEPMDPANIPFAICMTLLAFIGLLATGKENPFEALRLGGILFLFPLMYYFTHPEPYHLRPLDPILQMLDCVAVVRWRALLPTKTAAKTAETVTCEV